MRVDISSFGSTIIFFTNSTKDEVVTFEEITTPPTVLVTKNIVETPQPIEEFKPRYGFTDEDIYLLAQVLCGGKNTDGDGEYDIDFQKEINYYEVGKVLGVIMNRVRSNDFPNTVHDVVLQKGQFSGIPRNLIKEPSEIALETVREWCTAYDNYISFVQVVPINHLYFTGDGLTNKTRAKFK